MKYWEISNLNIAFRDQAVYLPAHSTAAKHTIILILILPKSIKYVCVEAIYFFEMNTSNVLKISVISRVRSTIEFSDIFNT